MSLAKLFARKRSKVEPTFDAPAAAAEPLIAQTPETPPEPTLSPRPPVTTTKQAPAPQTVQRTPTPFATELRRVSPAANTASLAKPKALAKPVEIKQRAESAPRRPVVAQAPPSETPPPVSPRPAAPSPATPRVVASAAAPAQKPAAPANKPTPPGPAADVTKKTAAPARRMLVPDIVKRLRKAQPDALGQVNDQRAVLIVRNVLQQLAGEINQLEKETLNIPALGTFVAHQVTNQTTKNTARRIGFRPNLQKR